MLGFFIILTIVVNGGHYSRKFLSFLAQRLRVKGQLLVLIHVRLCTNSMRSPTKK